MDGSRLNGARPRTIAARASTRSRRPARSDSLPSAPSSSASSRRSSASCRRPDRDTGTPSDAPPTIRYDGGVMTRLILIAAVIAFATAIAGVQGSPPITIRTGRLLDGRGGAPRNVVIRIEGGRIVSVGQSAGPVTHDLSKYTLLPGFIDTHVHILWHFGKDGRFQSGGEAPEDRRNAGLVNARMTVEHGFTTVQSVGEAGDLDLRKVIDAKC